MAPQVVLTLLLLLCAEAGECGVVCGLWSNGGEVGAPYNKRHSGVQYSGEEDCATDSVSNKDTLVHNTVVL